MSPFKLPVKLSWLERAKETHNYHRSKRIEDHHWKVTDTAKALRRSSGSISEDLTIASFYQTHKEDLEKLETCREALEWIRNKQKEIEIGEELE